MGCSQYFCSVSFELFLPSPFFFLLLSLHASFFCQTIAQTGAFLSSPRLRPQIYFDAFLALKIHVIAAFLAIYVQFRCLCFVGLSFEKQFHLTFWLLTLLTLSSCSLNMLLTYRCCCGVYIGWAVWSNVICRRRYAIRRNATWFCLGWTASWTKSYRKWWSNASRLRFRWNIFDHTTASHMEPAGSCPGPADPCGIITQYSVSLFWLAAAAAFSVGIGHRWMRLVHHSPVVPIYCGWFHHTGCSATLWLMVGPPYCHCSHVMVVLPHYRLSTARSRRGQTQLELLHFSLQDQQSMCWCIKYWNVIISLHRRAVGQFWKQLASVIAVKCSRFEHLNMVFYVTVLYHSDWV